MNARTNIENDAQAARARTLRRDEILKSYGVPEEVLSITEPETE